MRMTNDDQDGQLRGLPSSMNPSDGSGTCPTVQWIGNSATGFLRLIDQTRLPTEFVEIDCRDVPAVWEAIKALRVRGAPAIGIAAAYGAVLGARRAARAERIRFAAPWAMPRHTCAQVDRRPSTCSGLSTGWTLLRLGSISTMARRFLDRLLSEARQIDDEDRAMCRAIGRHGAQLVQPGQGILTHCNAGGLATADYGTALAVVFAAHESGIPLHVFADETRPLFRVRG